MVKFIDDLTEKEMRKLVNFIGHGTRPIKQARVLFPENTGRGSARVVRHVSNYCWNKITAITLKGKENKEIRTRYLDIAVGIYMELPEYAKSIDLSRIPKEK